MKHRFLSRSLLVVLTAITVVVMGCAIAPSTRAQIVTEATAQTVINQELTVFRSPTCGCCHKWIEHMQAAGFQMQDNVTEEMDAVKAQYGIPRDLESCHTAIAGGYAIEGHVPAVDIQRLLTEKPDVAGIVVPGMPIGAPGMESGDEVDPYTVFTFSESGDTTVFAEHS